MWIVDRKQFPVSFIVPLTYWYSVTFEFLKFLLSFFFFFFSFIFCGVVSHRLRNIMLFLDVSSSTVISQSHRYCSISSRYCHHLFMCARRKYLCYSARAVKTVPYQNAWWKLIFFIFYLIDVEKQKPAPVTNSQGLLLQYESSFLVLITAEVSRHPEMSIIS